MIRNILATALATWFWSGRLPGAPGTWGSLAALPFGWALITWSGPGGLVTATVIVFLAGVWASGIYATLIGKKDPGSAVIDEVAGLWLTLLPVAFIGPDDWRLYGIAFIAFRLFDITKPWPVRKFEMLPSGWGIMADDIVAGLYAVPFVWVAALLLT